MKPLCRAHWVGAHPTGRRQYRWAKANKDVLCALLFLCNVFFNFLRGGRRLPYLALFIPANRLVAFCLQVTQPEVTFNFWTKKINKKMWSCSVAQPLSLTRLLIQQIEQGRIHGLKRKQADPQRDRGGRKDPTCCIHQSLSVHPSPLMPHHETEQN